MPTPLPPDPEAHPLVDLVLPLPVDWVVDVIWALGRMEKRGYRLYFREADGMGRVWASLSGPGPTVSA